MVISVFAQMLGCLSFVLVFKEMFAFGMVVPVLEMVLVVFSVNEKDTLEQSNVHMRAMDRICFMKIVYKYK
jgi:hypothetical protein